MKKTFPFKIILSIVLALLAVYFVTCLTISVTFDKLLKEIYRSRSIDDINPSIHISEEIYNRMNIKMDFVDQYHGNENDDFKNRFPITFIGVKKIKVYYAFSYNLYDENGGFFAGCSNVTANATLRFVDGRLTIVDYWEHI